MKPPVILVLLLIVSFPASGRATVACKEEDKAKAKVLFQQGSAHYEAGRFKEAAQVFANAQRRCSTAAMLYNLAMAYDRAGEWKLAIGYYQDFLNRNPIAKGAAKIKARISMLQERVKALGAADAGKAPAEEPRPPSRDMPEMEPSPWDDLYKVVPSSGDKPSITDQPRPRYKRPWAWVSLGMGLALAATGTTLLATRRVDHWQRADTGQIQSVTDEWWPGATLVAAGAVAAGVSAWLFIRNETSASINLAVAPGPGLVVLGNF